MAVILSYRARAVERIKAGMNTDLTRRLVAIERACLIRSDT